MIVLAIEKELSDITSKLSNTLLQSEAARAYQLYEEGFFREIYFNCDSHTAVIILECENLEDAGDLIGSLPLVKAGLIKFELHPLEPYTGFSRLFANNQE